ncbi:membrane lipoprotein lipid attachment site-containing protein [Erysipelothrix rhusiopathiae]|uniref:membrane lipoprotein lipid attachment site-containing protein n=1 Tax=Erysipelothrix rhusiopathiae TaxID=1648 RepID=UPI000F435DC1|nr:membrane lipoprotein lipid attachment site-containing protein [Erysipelothrix rhusiopathiae]AYV34908.1 hypothetical protein EEY85_06195 [Erysipelothrix rhusiopathiae]MDE8082233.1 membrane lipoprotein lipid attachment site-containing protein [Erysipelothrix rhusiopathiae]MDE8314343.1 membrane lipoprotein lipid attachment site-containing protein [Erysipelothrix rhusiopathiae]MDE8329688.1 membrane lipoprotein lipid attachment site-containing protein [Erysipelothrix rhusiopathiae]MDE8332979.1 m
MKKLFLVLLSMFLLTGCSVNEKKLYTEKLKRYESYWNAINDNDRFVESSRFFDISATIEKHEDLYVYGVVVDKPKIAMYGVEIVVLENNEDYHADKMMPTAGIFDSEYNLVPGQVRKDRNYMGGISLAGEVDVPEVTLNVLVSWRNNTKLETQREFVQFKLKYEEPKKEESKSNKDDSKKEEPKKEEVVDKTDKDDE